MEAEVGTDEAVGELMGGGVDTSVVGAEVGGEVGNLVGPFEIV